MYHYKSPGTCGHFSSYFDLLRGQRRNSKKKGENLYLDILPVVLNVTECPANYSRLLTSGF